MTMMSFPALYFCALVAATGLAGLIAGQADAEQAASPLLQLEVKIPLGDVEGRIDHLAIDLSRNGFSSLNSATVLSASSTSRVVRSFTPLVG